jgi:phosphatidylserine/phosphatidylglycerophosphate/cardiolipin synthase-like enzyme
MLDADVVRCAAPWPGLAAQLIEAMVAIGDVECETERLCATVAAGLDAGDAVQVLTGLATAGVCHRHATGEKWSSRLSKSELRRLAELLRGADHYRRLRLDAASVELAVTMPLSPSLLGAQLSTSPSRPGGYLPTAEAFLRVARAAQTRLVVMTPFLDRRGFKWLKEVVEAAPTEAQKIVVLRDAHRYVVDLGVQHAAWLAASAVFVFDYCLSHDHDSGRGLPVETFHAKIVLADEKLAYVGSANMLGTGEGTSLEAGVLVDGRAAAQVARLVAGVRRIARRREWRKNAGNAHQSCGHADFERCRYDFGQ